MTVSALLSDSGCFQPDVRSWSAGPVWLLVSYLTLVSDLDLAPPTEQYVRLSGLFTECSSFLAKVQ